MKFKTFKANAARTLFWNSSMFICGYGLHSVVRVPLSTRTIHVVVTSRATGGDCFKINDPGTRIWTPLADIRLGDYPKMVLDLNFAAWLRKCRKEGYKYLHIEYDEWV